MELLSLLNEKEKALGEVINFLKGENLFAEGDRCKGIYFLIQGSLKIVSYTLEGNEIIYRLLDGSGLFGHNLIFSKEPFYRGSVIANSEGSLLYFSKENLLKPFQNKVIFLEEYLKAQSEAVKSMNAQIKILSMPSASERLYYFLSLNNGAFTYSSISSFASILFLQRETLSRLLHKEAKEKRIIIKGKRIMRS